MSRKNLRKTCAGRARLKTKWVYTLSLRKGDKVKFGLILGLVLAVLTLATFTQSDDSPQAGMGNLAGLLRRYPLHLPEDRMQTGSRGIGLGGLGRISCLN